jgi:cathepsin L
MKFPITAAVATTASGTSLRDWTDYSVDQYQSEFQKAYLGKEEQDLRRRLFEAELHEVQAQNVEYANKRSTWYATMNEFSDLSAQEQSQLRKGRANVDMGPRPAAVSLDRLAANPDKFDWREHNVATKVKNQGGCGSCWAFGSTAVLESHYAIATGKLVVLAPQAYVNCAPNPNDCGGTGGCEGSIPELAFNWSATKGLPLEADLRYEGHDAPCKPYKAAVQNSGGYVKLQENSAEALETAVATQGPIAVNVAANWMRYGGGIFSGGCTGTSCTLDHIVAVYGYDKAGEGYWLVRNSWSETWGENGYIRLSRKNDNVTYTDTSPKKGTGCKPFPKVQRVMGESGVLFDTSYPTGVGEATDATLVV